MQEYQMFKFSEFELLGQGNCLLRTFYVLRKLVLCQIFYNYFSSVCHLSLWYFRLYRKFKCLCSPIYLFLYGFWVLYFV